MDSSGNSDIEAARAIKHSMVQKEVEHKLSGQTTDNGGGATLESFAKELRSEEVTNQDYYSVANCTLHDLSLGVSVPVGTISCRCCTQYSIYKFFMAVVRYGNM
jgi:hypothetical protein